MTGYSNDQISVGQQILSVVKSLGLSPSDTAAAELAAIEGGLAESGLKNVGYGDYPSSMGGQMSSSRGVYQQIGAWGPLDARMDVPTSTRMFLSGGQGGQTGLLSVPGWNKMNSWNAVQAVQGSEFSDGSNYEAQLSSAQDFISQYGAGTALTPGTSAAGAPSSGTPSSGTPSGGTYTAKPASAGIFTGVEMDALSFVLKLAFAATGMGLIALGLWRLSAPARGKAESAATTAAAAA